MKHQSEKKILRRLDLARESAFFKTWKLVKDLKSAGVSNSITLSLPTCYFYTNKLLIKFLMQSFSFNPSSFKALKLRNWKQKLGTPCQKNLGEISRFHKEGPIFNERRPRTHPNCNATYEVDEQSLAVLVIVAVVVVVIVVVDSQPNSRIDSHRLLRR